MGTASSGISYHLKDIYFICRCCCRKGRTIRSRISYRICMLRHSMFLEQFWAECEHHDKFQPIPLPPPQWSDSFTRWSVKLSPHLQYTGSLLKRSENRDSLLKRMCCQVWSLQQRRVRAQTTLSVTCHYLRIGPTTGSLARSPDSSSLLWTI